MSDELKSQSAKKVLENLFLRWRGELQCFSCKKLPRPGDDIYRCPKESRSTCKNCHLLSKCCARGDSTEETNPKKQNPLPATPLASISFGNFPSNLSFELPSALSTPLNSSVYIFGDKSEKLNSTTLNSSDEPGAENYENVEHDPQHDPIVPLPELVDVTTGEENEQVAFQHSAKLYRFDKDTKEWKERGVGDLKILFHPSKKSYRVVLRRYQVHKIACNHYINVEQKLEPMSSSQNSLTWFAMDFSDDEKNGKVEKLAVRFKEVTTKDEFKKAFEDAQERLKNGNASPPVFNLANELKNLCKPASGPIHKPDSMMAKMLEVLPFQCINVVKGCNEILFKEDLFKHEKVCDFRWINCADLDCKDSNVRFIDYVDHFKSKHRDCEELEQEGSEFEYETDFSFLFHGKKFKPKKMVAFDHVFFQVGVIRESIVYFWIYMLGSRKEAKNFYYQMKLAKEGSRKELTFNGQVRSMAEFFEDIVNGEVDTFTFSMKLAEQFKNKNGLVRFNLKLENCKEESKDKNNESGIDEEQWCSAEESDENVTNH